MKQLKISENKEYVPNIALLPYFAYQPYFTYQWQKSTETPINVKGKNIYIMGSINHTTATKKDKYIEQRKKGRALQIIDNMASISRTELSPGIIVTFATFEYGGTKHTGVSIKSPKDPHDDPGIGIDRALSRMYRAITKNREFVIPQQQWLGRKEVVTAGRALLNQK